MRGVILSQVAFLLTVCAVGCHPPQSRHVYQTVFSHNEHDFERARRANARGLQRVAGNDLSGAETAFRDALRADLRCAAAHNNLGLILLQRGPAGTPGAYYEAALEFSFAHKLDKRAVEPLLNLGRLYETLGWDQSALAQYEKALSIDDRCVEALGRSAYTLLKTGKNPQAATARLEALAQSRAEGDWQRWALARLETTDRTAAP